MRDNLKTNKLYCFSPPVMLATFAIEIACALYVVFRYKLTPVSRLAVMILVCLAVFQLAEYYVCEGAWGVDSLTWAKFGYVAITLLPPLGLQLATRIAGQKQRVLVGVAYLSAAAFISIFLFVGQGMRSEECLGNYVIFKIAPWASLVYGLYYYGWLFVTIGYCWWVREKLSARSKKTALLALSLGYLAFIVPTTAANIIDPTTREGIPSIMCGFAVILALILTFFVLPSYTTSDKRKRRT